MINSLIFYLTKAQSCLSSNKEPTERREGKKRAELKGLTLREGGRGRPASEPGLLGP